MELILIESIHSVHTLVSNFRGSFYFFFFGSFNDFLWLISFLGVWYTLYEFCDLFYEFFFFWCLITSFCGSLRILVIQNTKVHAIHQFLRVFTHPFFFLQMLSFFIFIHVKLQDYLVMRRKIYVSHKIL